MAVQSIKNQYVGINAHLHSVLQTEGGWDVFHNNHISDLTRLLRVALLPMGYTAESEQGLQIKHYEELTGKPEADVLIYDTDPIRAALSPAASISGTAQLAIPIPELVGLTQIEPVYYRAISLYKHHRKKGDKPIGWIELLSPSNKPGGQDARDYREKRNDLLQAGFVFIELDYLHETPSTFDRILVDSPYRIVVVNPQPSFQEGNGHIYPFHADERLPMLEIPLSGDDHLLFSFDRPYQKTFEEMSFGVELVDYTQLPVNFESYTPADRLRILHRMITVLEAAKQAQDLEQAPFPLVKDEFTLESAMERYKSLSGQ